MKFCYQQYSYHLHIHSLQLSAPSVQGVALDVARKMMLKVDGALSSWSFRQSYAITALYKYNMILRIIDRVANIF